MTVTHQVDYCNCCCSCGATFNTTDESFRHVKDSASEAVAKWNETNRHIGPATLRFRPEEGGWIATYTRWA